MARVYPNPGLVVPQTFRTFRKPGGAYSKVLSSKGAFDVTDDWEAELLEESFGTAFDSTIKVGPTAHWKYAAEVLADSPLLYWRMNTANITSPWHNPVEPDLGPSGYTGYVFSNNVDGITTAGGVTSDGNASVHFNVGSMYNTSAGTLLAANSARTFEAWFYRTNVNAITMFMGGGHGSNQSAFYIYNDGTGRNIAVAPLGNTGTVSTFTNAMPVSRGLNEWMHIAVAVNGNGASGNVKMWVNGVLQSSPANFSTFGTNSFFAAGLWQYGPGPVNFGHFVGRIDEVAVYSGVLSDARVLAHYNAR